MQILTPAEWLPRRAAHEEKVRPLVADRLARAFRHERHPVEDFLFEYYSLRPAQLLKWHPGIGIALTGEESAEFLQRPDYVTSPAGVTARPLPEKRIPATRWIKSLLDATAGRPGFYGCHGLHEWAMVYRSPTVRHGDWPLRLRPAEIEDVLHTHPVRCSHFDAFRFFTPAARPLNRLQPTRESALDLEQPACLHANMDLYKWAYKLLPYTPSELVVKSFELARDIRELDMRASPYDLSRLGYEPVPIETPAGRDCYEENQRGFAKRAAGIRRSLSDLCATMLKSVPALRATAVATCLAVSALVSGCSTGRLPEAGEPVVGLMAERLEIAKDVAWAKWANGLPVRDAARERALLEKMALQAEMTGLNGAAVTRLMRAQIDASCLQQEYWMNTWRQGQGLPPGEPPTLDKLRIRLDSVSSLLVAEWAALAGKPLPAGAVKQRLVSAGVTPKAAAVAASGVSR